MEYKKFYLLIIVCLFSIGIFAQSGTEKISISFSKIPLKEAMARVEKIRPVYAVIQPVVVPLKPSKPRKMTILVMYVFLSGAGSLVWVLFAKGFLKDLKKRRVADG